MNVEIGTEAAQFSEKEYIGFLLQCIYEYKNTPKRRKFNW